MQENGEYDNVGFRYRGRVITGPDGAFRFRTIMPALYSCPCQKLNLDEFEFDRLSSALCKLKLMHRSRMSLLDGLIWPHSKLTCDCNN
jgi:protocatechuate 3,4-dioxygenase beta subunit